MSRKDNELAIEDIGPPSDFRHLTHVGWDPIAGFNLDNIADDSQLKHFLDRAGVKKQEPQTSTDLITQNEGLQVKVFKISLFAHVLSCA
jgi:P21-Rho-binding domain